MKKYTYRCNLFYLLPSLGYYLEIKRNTFPGIEEYKITIGARFSTAFIDTSQADTFFNDFIGIDNEEV